MDDQASETTVHTSNSTLGKRPNIESEPSLHSSYYDQFDVVSSSDGLPMNSPMATTTEDDLETPVNIVFQGTSGATTARNGEGGTRNDNINGRNGEDNDDDDDDDDDSDPLQIQSLILNYDYLQYKIQDLTNGLSEQITNSILHFQHDSEKQLSDVDLEKYRVVLNKSKELGLELEKFDQFAFITRDFITRLKDLEQRLAGYNKSQR
ncbi:unnamed protein product [Ambrosiozyma monospora]|uniref:Biogenesis of lysosome-related organelles complex 1 subunit CNL1 n=1 Tax=Ambrosiozyma monospora TaxID=43982 RepID=A0A9W7DI35_AMBMO|nr:unnamed protein product [Ambrosiozyma monospora]